MEDLRELIRVLDGPVLGAKLQDGLCLFGADARQLEQLGRIREIDPHRVGISASSTPHSCIITATRNG